MLTADAVVRADAITAELQRLSEADPGYAQLRRATDRSIREGAEDESEIGVMRTLFQPQRETNLRIRLDEYLRFGLHAGIFYVT